MCSGSLQKLSVGLAMIGGPCQRAVVDSIYRANVDVVLVVMLDRAPFMLLVGLVLHSLRLYQSFVLTFPESCVLFLQTRRLFRLFPAFSVPTLTSAVRLLCYGTSQQSMFLGLNTGNVFYTRQAEDVGL